MFCKQPNYFIVVSEGGDREQHSPNFLSLQFYIL